jgi:ribosomal protein L12E/L44/L45/RPP1/RPP2
MASVPVNKLSQAEKDQLAISYAALVLSGSGAEVTADSLNNVLKASGVAANASLVSVIAKALKGKDVSQYLGGVSAGSAPAASTPATNAPAAKTEKKADKK